jgi:hypothetical protein
MPSVSRPFPGAVTYDAGIGDRGRVRAGARTRQCETGNIVATREAREVIVLLLLRAVLVQQLGGPERVRNGDDGRRGDGATCDLREDARVCERGEFEPAVLLRDDHREEALLLQEGPHLRRKVGALVRDLPIVEHRAELVDRTVEEGALLDAEARRRNGKQLVPVGRAAEELAIPPHRARIQRLTLRLRHRRQQLPVLREERARDVLASQVVEVQRRHAGGERDEDGLPKQRAVAEDHVGEHEAAHQQGRAAQSGALIREREAGADEQNQPEE